MKITKSKFKIWAGMLLALALMLGLNQVALADDPVTVTVSNSGGTAIPNVPVYYRVNGTTDWTSMGKTNGNGEATVSLPTGTYDFHAVYHETTATDAAVDVLSTTAVTFTTQKTTVTVKDSGDNPLDDVAIYYKTGYVGHDDWIKIGNTTGGQVELETFSRTIDFHAVYNETTATQTGVTSGSTVDFQTEKTTVQVNDSSGGPLNGVPIYYKTGYVGHDDWIKIGKTGTNGQVELETFSRTIDFHAVYHETTATQADMASGSTVTFNTYKTVVQVLDCANNGVSDVEIYYRTGYVGHDSWIKIAKTNANGQVAIEFFPRGAGADFHARTSADWMTATKSDVSIPNSSPNTVTFQMKNVDLQFGGSITWKNPKGQWKPFNSPMNMFPRTYEFKFAGHPRTIVVSSDGACTYSETVILVCLIDSDGNGLAGGTTHHWDYGNWRDGQTTGPDGCVFKSINPPSNPNLKVKMAWRYTYQEITQDINTNAVFEFQTVKAIAKLLSSQEAPLSGANISYWGYGNWRTLGTTDANGETSNQLLPGSYRLKASYLWTFAESAPHDISSGPYTFQTVNAQAKYQTCDGTGIPGATVSYRAYGNWRNLGTTDANGVASREILPGSYTLKINDKWVTNQTPAPHDITSSAYTFQATTVTYNYSGNVRYYAYGNWRSFTKPTMNLLPGTYRFRFDDLQQDITVSGCDIGGAVAIIRLLDSNGNGLAGGTAKYYDGGWQTIGTTDASGVLFHTWSESKGKLKFRMEYGGARQEFYQNVSANSNVTFQTVNVTVNLKDHNGNTDNLAEGTAKYYASGWKTIGQTQNGVATVELLPLKYKFRMEYGGARQEFYQNVGTNSTVDFQTTLVTVNLKDHNGNLGNLAESKAKYYASGWKTIGTTVNGVASIELLPLKYKFRMEYGGARQEFYQNVGTNSTVDFQTVLVTVKLQTGAGGPLSGGVAKYYASGWKTIGTTDGNGETTIELLPLKYKFRMEYNGARDEKYQNVSQDQTVIFQGQNTLPTVKLLDSQGNGIEGGVVKYYASGWKNFGTTDKNGQVQKDDLLQGRYKFRMEYGGARQEKYYDISTEQPLVFQTVNVTVNLKDSNGNTLPAEGTAKYYASGWKLIGTTVNGVASVELLPVKYKFRIEYRGARQERHQDVGQNNIVDFQTASVTVNLQNSSGATGALPEEGTAKYYASGWKSVGPMVNGVASIELLPVKYKFRMEYRGARVEKHQTIQPGANTVDFQTTNVVASLKNCQGVGQANATMKFYASGWKTLGQTNTNGETSAELLPVKYKFRVEYGGARNEKHQQTNTNPNVAFTTTTVALQFSGTIRYYASGWKTFTKPTMEMLPGKYNFRFDDLRVNNVSISGCTLDGSLTVKIPGLSGIRIEIRNTDGSLVTYRNNQSNESVFDLTSGIYDVVLKHGEKTKVVEDVVVLGTATLDNLVAELTVDLEGLRGVRVEVRTDDGATDTAGGLVFYHNNQSGERKYKVLRNSYDLVLKQGEKTKLVNAVDCYGETCSAGDIVAAMTVDYEGLRGVRIEVRTESGGLVFYHNNQSGVKMYDVLKNTYDLVFKHGEKTKTVGVDCTANTCAPDDFVATMTVNYETMRSVRIEVRTDDGDGDDSVGGLVFYHNNQSGTPTYDVLKNTYDLVFKHGDQTKIVDVDCTANTCDAGNFAATLTVNYEGLQDVRIEVRTDDGDGDNSAGGMVFYHNNQSSTRTYDVLMATYDLVFKHGAKVKHVDVNCTADTCDAGDIVAQMPVDYENLSGVRIEVRTGNGTPGTAGDLVFYHNNQSGVRNYDVLKNSYDLVFKHGAKTKIVDAVNCYDDATCSPGDFVATLTVNYGALRGVRIEVRTNDGSVGTAGDPVFYHNNQSGVRNYDVLKNHYDVLLKMGNHAGVADAVNCTGNTCALEKSRLTVQAPDGTAVQVRTADGSHVVANVNNVGSDKKHTFNDLDIGLYDIVLKQGATEKTLDDVFVFGNPTLDELCHLTVIAPDGTTVEVRVPGGGGRVTRVNNVGSDKKQVLDVVKGTYDLWLKQGAGEKTLTGAEAIDCTGETATVDQLARLTVIAPDGTTVEVRVQGGSGRVTGVNNVGSDKKQVLDVVKGTYDLWLKQGAGEKTIASVNVNGDTSVDQLCQLTVIAPDGTTVEVRVQGSTGRVTRVNNVGSDKRQVLDVIKGTYDLWLKQGAGEKTLTGAEAIDCTDETATADQLARLTVTAPDGTTVEVRVQGDTGQVTRVSNVGSDKKQVLDVVKGTYDLWLKQGTGTKTVAGVNVTSDISEDQLCQLTVVAPDGTMVEVRVQGSSDKVTGVNNVGSDKKQVLDVVKGTYDLWLKQGAGEKTVPDVDCTGETQSENQLVKWTVQAPDGTQVKIYTKNRSGVVTSINNVGSDKKHVFDVIPNTAPNAYDLYLKQGAQETWLDNVTINGNTTSDQLCQLTVNASNGTAVSVYVIETTNVVTHINNVGSDNKHVFDVVKNTYDVTNGTSTEEDVDCLGENQTVTFQ